MEFLRKTVGNIKVLPSKSVKTGVTFRPDGGGMNFNTSLRVLEIQGISLFVHERKTNPR